jgi:hypothetical protein
MEVRGRDLRGLMETFGTGVNKRRQSSEWRVVIAKLDSDKYELEHHNRKALPNPFLHPRIRAVHFALPALNTYSILARAYATPLAARHTGNRSITANFDEFYDGSRHHSSRGEDSSHGEGDSSSRVNKGEFLGTDRGRTTFESPTFWTHRRKINLAGVAGNDRKEEECSDPNLCDLDH